MIKTIMRAIRVALAAMPRLIMKTMEIGGRLVSMLLAVPAEPPTPEPAAEYNTDDVVTYLEAIRTAAAHLAADQVPPEAAANVLSGAEAAWLTALDRPMLCKIVGTGDDALLAHMRRQKVIRGVLAADPQAVADYRAAQRRRKAEDFDEPHASAASTA